MENLLPVILGFFFFGIPLIRFLVFFISFICYKTVSRNPEKYGAQKAKGLKITWIISLVFFIFYSLAVVAYFILMGLALANM